MVFRQKVPRLKCFALIMKLKMNKINLEYILFSLSILVNKQNVFLKNTDFQFCITKDCKFLKIDNLII